MNILLNAFQKLLRGNITDVPDADIYYGSRYSPIDKTPCITLEVASETFIARTPLEIRNVEFLKKTYDSEIWINVWCNSEEERARIVNDVHDILLKAEINHYLACPFYETGDCVHLNDTCLCFTMNTGRANKNQCPNVGIYKSFFRYNHILKKTFQVGSILNMDELNTTEPLLRTIFRLTMRHSIYKEVGGRPFEELKISEELL